MSRVAWVLTDPITSDVYPLPVNPHTDGGSFGLTRNTAYQVNGASFYRDASGFDRIGDTLAMDKPSESISFRFEGFTYSSEELLLLASWVQKPYVVQVIDDLGRDFNIFFRNFSISRVRSRNRWKHAYTFEGIVV